jgi:hypothetical protein
MRKRKRKRNSKSKKNNKRKITREIGIEIARAR